MVILFLDFLASQSMVHLQSSYEANKSKNKIHQLKLKKTEFYQNYFVWRDIIYCNIDKKL
jgi:hypothetical protein